MQTANCPAMTLSNLPNELLLDILSLLPTRDLLDALRYSHHFHHLALRILEQRLSTAANYAASSLLLECHRPSLKYSEPPLHCTYLGTDGLDTPSSTPPPPGTRLAHLNTLYARFRPFHYQHQVDRVRARRRFAGDIRGSRTHPDTDANVQATRSATPSPSRQVTVRQTLFLDSFELFTQLCASTALVLANGPSGYIHSSVPVSNGIIRVWRRFLADACTRGDGGEKVETPLWVNDGENVGVKFVVRRLGRDEDEAEEDGDGDADDDEEPVSYEIRYDELHVRAMHLLLAVEKSMQLQAERDACSPGLGELGMAAGMDAGARGTVLFDGGMANPGAALVMGTS